MKYEPRLKGINILGIPLEIIIAIVFSIILITLVIGKGNIGSESLRSSSDFFSGAIDWVSQLFNFGG